MWGGRFSTGPADIMREINSSISFDKRLWREDIAASKAHAAMLRDQNLIPMDAAAEILHGLDQIAGEFEQEGVPENLELEDIHMTVEQRLSQLIGPAAGWLHTARSRNDQVATDLKLWVRNACDEAIAGVVGLQRVLVARAEEHADTIMPGFTHMQIAQPLTLGHHLLAHYEMLRRDASRFDAARERLNECPLGSAALAGTSFPVDREATAKALGFDAPTANSLDAVSDRDFALDYLFAAAQCSLHLSRLGEELVLWSSPAFGFVELPDAFSSGSSIMPQKRNPDAAELVRGHAGRIIGSLTSVMIMMKALPLGYSKDLQDDKQPLFEAHDLLIASLRALTGMMAAVAFIPERMYAAATQGHSTATDLADWLVQHARVPFREAHGVAGACVKAADERGCGLDELPIEILQSVDDRITGDVYGVLSAEMSVRSRRSYGGTAPDLVRKQLAAAKLALARP